MLKPLQQVRHCFAAHVVGALICFFVGLHNDNQTLAQEQPASVVSFPYQAFVVRDSVSVYSGPGIEHYASMRLSKGDMVDVYRHDPNDWCAIRPPEDSFSMVPADAIEVIEKGVGRAKDDGVQVWVGTELGPVENPLWQVKLKKDEEIRILGEVNYPSPEGFSTSWFQIKPPPGEFRWIKHNDLLLPDDKTQLSRYDDDAQPQQKGSERIPDSDDRISAVDNQIKTSQSSDILDDPFAAEREATANGSSDNLGWRKAKQPMRFASNDLNSSPSTTTTSSIENSNWNLSSSSNSGNSDYVAEVATVLSPTVGYELLTDRLQKVEIRLASEIVKPAETWNLNEFADQLLKIQETSISPMEKTQAMKLIEKIDRLRGTQATLLQTNLPGSRPPASTSQDAVGSGVDTSIKHGFTYDAFGWLNELVQNSGKDQPTYVLQNENGKILCQIDPAPGLDLHRFLRSKVGVIGTRGFNQRLKLNHVTAERVVELEKATMLR